ncbi:MAG: hypothetical protein MUE81_03445 [Thermoflexibacter sp.]|jgi:hypothetical protein|nr:hypothetical protein [Thermoflexibacter sp.]
MPNFPFPFYHYGSDDSKDQDVIIIIPDSLMPQIQEERKIMVNDLLNKQQKNWNATLATIQNGYLTDTIYPKSWIDSLNNSLFTTYHLHAQQYENPIKGLLKRNKLLAIYKTARTVLSLLTRTHLRRDIRPIVNGIHSFDLKIKALKIINWHDIDDFNQRNAKNEDIWKTFAFYIGQNISLIEHNIEIYTKKDLVLHHPALDSLIYRRGVMPKDKSILQEYLMRWIGMAENYGVYTSENGILKCKDEIIDMKNEIFLKT